MGYVSFSGGRVSRQPMHSQFKDQARRDLLDRAYAQFPTCDWLRMWVQFATYGGFYYAYGIIAQVLRDYAGKKSIEFVS